MDGEKSILNNSSSSEESVHSISILLVDNDLTCLSIVAAMLKNFNYLVVTARHPQDALYTLRLKEGAFDLVISDVHMPDMDGFELRKAIEQEFNLPVVLMSAEDHDGIVSTGLDNEATFFIPKPVSADDLRDIWRFASTNKKKQVIVEETGSLPDPETSSDKFILHEITISDSSTDEDMDMENDSKKKSPKKRMSNENREVSASSPPKKPKLMWTNSLHNHFLEAIRKIGLDKAVPKKILEVMNVPGLTRENVASHLQKYRMFLRRVSDASLEIRCGSDEGLTRRFISSLKPSGCNSWTSIILNNFSKNNYQNPRVSPNSNPFFRNLSASSSSVSSGSTFARLLANKGNFRKPNVTSSNLMIHDTGRSCIRFGQNSSNIQTMPSVENPFSTTSPGILSKYGLLARFNTSSSGENIRTSSNSVSTEPSKSFAHPRTNYVGYRLSNLRHLAESGLFQKNQGVQSNSGVVNLPNAEIHGNNLNSEANFDELLDQFLADSSAPPSAPNNNSEKQSDVIADYQKLITSSDISLQNGDGMHGDTYSSLFDLDGFDIMSTQQPLDGVQLYHTTAADPASFNDQEQARQDHQCDVSQELEATPRLGEIHQSLNETQPMANKYLANSLEFNVSSQLNDIYLSPTCDEDEELLESLFMNFFGDNQTLDGV